MKLIVWIFFVLLFSNSGFTQEGHLPRFKRVITLVFENESSWSTSSTPFFAKIKGQGASLERFYGLARPSQPNYIAMISGSTHGIKDNKRHDLDKLNIVDLLENAGIDWRAYAEDYPGGCFLEAGHNKYVRKHVPFLSFTNITQSPLRCSKVVGFESLFSDWEQGLLPPYVFITPNQDSNAHDTNIEYADSWFEKNFSRFIESPEFMKDTLFVVTFDEGSWMSQKIYTVLLGPSVIAGSKNKDKHNHYSILKLIQDEWGLGSLGLEDSKASPIQGIWK